MSQFDKETLKNLERLSRIKCTPEEEEEIVESLKKILDYVDRLSEVNTEEKPCCHVSENFLTNVMREDIEKNPMKREVFLENAADQIGSMIRVPPIIQ